MDGKLGNETKIGLPLESSTMSPNYEICALKLVFLSFRRYLVEIDSNCRHARNFHTRFYLQMHLCVNVSASKFQSPNLPQFTTNDLPIVCPFFGWPSSYVCTVG